MACIATATRRAAGLARTPAALVAPAVAAGLRQRRAASVLGKGNTCDAVVIGAGVLGAACALELRREGFTTISVDSNPSPGYGSTSSSSSIVRHFYSLEQSVILSYESFHGWKAWADVLEAPPGEDLATLRQIGMAAVHTPQSPGNDKYISNVKAACSALNIGVEEWTAADLQRQLPFMSTTMYYPPRRANDERFGEESGESIAGALFSPEAGYVSDPQLAARNLAEAVLRRGGSFLWRSRVKEINLDATKTAVRGVTLEDGSKVEAPIVINVAGPHSPLVHRLAFKNASVEDDSKIDSRPLRVEVAYVPEPPNSNVDKCLPVTVDMDVGVYYRPEYGGNMLVGSVEPECDPLEFLNSAEDLQEGLSEEWTNLVYRAALRFPTLQVPNTAAGIAALYDTTPDWVPIYDRSALRGFYSMRGTSGNQFKNAPVVGRICARLVDSCENGYDHDKEPVKVPMRFQPNRELDLSVFSRLRAGLSTSGTVMG